MDLPHLLALTYSQMLGALSTWLDKAQAGLPADQKVTLLSARLAPDMFPLSTQVRFACVQAQEGMYRLLAREFPRSMIELLDEGRNGEENPGTIAEAQARIAETVALVEALSAEAFDANGQRPIAHELPMGLIFDLTAEQYARDWALPQFYFHLMTAYAILRSEGVALGKADYVAHMFGYLRPGTMPEAAH